MQTFRRLAVPLVALGGRISPGATSVGLAQGAAPSSITIRLLEAATNRADDPRSRIYINDHLAPGASITRRVEVSNTTGSSQRLEFYPSAAEVAGGAFSIANGRATNELTEWITVEPASAVVPDGGRQEFTVTLRVPSDAAPGERYAAVLAEKPPAELVPGAVSTGARVGIRVYLSVGPGGEPASDFQVDTLTALRDADRQPVVTAAVRNTGGRALDMSGELRLSEGPGGLSAGPFPATLGTTLGVGQRDTVSVVLDNALPDGPWRAELTLTSGLITRTVEGVLTFPEAAGESAEPVAAIEVPVDADNPFVLFAGALIGLLALLLLVLALLRRRSRRRDEDEDEDGIGASERAGALDAG